MEAFAKDISQKFLADRQVGLISALCEFVKSDEAPWLGELFGTFVRESRNPALDGSLYESLTHHIIMSQVPSALQKKYSSIQAVGQHDAYWANQD